MKLGAVSLVALSACAPRAAVAPTPQPAQAAERTVPIEPRAADSAQLQATTRTKIREYAFEAFPTWAASHPDKACPNTLAELNEYMRDPNVSDVNDAWGRPMKMMCGAYLPPGAKGIAILSRGQDGKEGTEDDILSWE